MILSSLSFALDYALLLPLLVNILQSHPQLHSSLTVRVAAMRLGTVMTGALGLAVFVAAEGSKGPLGELHEQAMNNLRKAEAENPPKPGQCSLATAARRKDW
jgi:hypothetical protein